MNASDVKAGKLYTKNNYKRDIDLTSQVDGINKIFTTPFAYTTEHIEVFKNGLKSTPGLGKGFIELSDTTFEFTNAPLIGDKVIINLLKK